MVNLWNKPHCFQGLHKSGNNGMSEQIVPDVHAEKKLSISIYDSCERLSSLCEQKQKSWFWVRIC